VPVSTWTITPSRHERPDSRRVTGTDTPADHPGGARLFLREGFQTTSLEQIGDEAGFARGAVYSNVPSKTAMGIAVVDELYAREAERLEEALSATEDERRPSQVDGRWLPYRLGKAKPSLRWGSVTLLMRSGRVTSDVEEACPARPAAARLAA
jgi:AcrR family transcriptional regulator